MSEYRLGRKWDQGRLSKLVIIWQRSRTIDEVCSLRSGGTTKGQGRSYEAVQGASDRLHSADGACDQALPVRRRFQVTKEEAVDEQRVKEICPECELEWGAFAHIPDGDCWQRRYSDLLDRSAAREAMAKAAGLEEAAGKVSCCGDPESCGFPNDETCGPCNTAIELKRRAAALRAAAGRKA